MIGGIDAAPRRLPVGTDGESLVDLKIPAYHRASALNCLEAASGLGDDLVRGV